MKSSEIEYTYSDRKDGVYQLGLGLMIDKEAA